MAFPQQDPMGDAIRLMSIVQQMKAQRQQTAQQHLENALSIAQPGTTFQQLGLSEKDLKRALGRAPKPDEIAKALTPQEVMRKQQLNLLQNATPEQLNVLSATSLATGAGAPAGLYTQQGFADTAGANAAAAKTQRKINESTSGTKVKTAQISAGNELKTQQTVSQAIDEGMKAWTSEFTGQQKSLIGQKTLFGQTGQEFTEQNVGSMLKTQIQREALKSVVDPTHPANKFWRQIGMDPAAGVAMIGLGAQSLIDTRLRLLATLQANQSERETAIQKADAEVAAEMGKKFGISAHSALREMNNLDAGKPPTTPFGAAFQQGLLMNYKATLNEAAIKGDPVISQLQALSQGALKLAGKNDELKNYTAVVNREAAETILRQRGIEPPLDPQGRETYNQAVQQITNQLSTFDKKGKHWWSDFGFIPNGAGSQSLAIPQGMAIPGAQQSSTAGAKPDTLDMSNVPPQQQAAMEGFIKALLNLQPGTAPAQQPAPNVPAAPQLGVPGLNPQK